MASPIVLYQDDDFSITLIRFIATSLLVLAGGFFAGLTLGLMGLDETHLQVMVETGSESEKKHALQVLKLLDKGKYWVLVTLLLSNVIVNETLPIVLDSLIGGGGIWAILISTALIVIFGEVIPQCKNKTICVRYGLAIGAKCSKIVLVIMYLLYPIAYPTSLVLNHFLGTTRGTTYKKAGKYFTLLHSPIIDHTHTGLKCLVSMHQSDDTEGLTSDEVHIISSVLDLKEKRVCDVMTPLKDVVTLSLDTVLDKTIVHQILKQGYSRIPVTAANDKEHYVGMLLVKRLISYDCSDELTVSKFPLSQLPETNPNTSCLDILNFFQEGKSHMALVTKYPGKQPLGVITLEDVIESLIGEEIVDETDIFVDKRKRTKVCREDEPVTPLLSAHSSYSQLPKSPSSELTGIKIRMNGYGAMVDSSGSIHTNSTQQQQPNEMHHENNNTVTALTTNCSSCRAPLPVDSVYRTCHTCRQQVTATGRRRRAEQEEQEGSPVRPRGRPRVEPSQTIPAAYISQLSHLRPLVLGRIDKEYPHCYALH
ncbi:hypothetical protein CU097_002646 [Rhizopus azygosporus]|uniref:CNNM transmembrane domain-containing protein n=1 Tax=Rhizopus azygosporus TaxID=86630 RepID=A0A367J7F6_RHIAZ|nr:hypothetical protein CU097_002646 [Rhizopus azygosporus]